MKSRILVLAVLLSCVGSVALAQSRQDIAGEWFGYITQTPAGLAERYFFELKLEMDGEQMKGESKIIMQDDTAIYGVMQLEISLAGDQEIAVHELHIRQQRLWTFAYWCLKDYRLVAQWVKGILILEGEWTSDACAGSAGFIHLERRLS